MTHKFCAEIAYGYVHTDLCCHAAALGDGEYRKLLHAALDEWLDRSDGDGGFWVGDPNHFNTICE